MVMQRNLPVLVFWIWTLYYFLFFIPVRIAYFGAKGKKTTILYTLRGVYDYLRGRTGEMK